MSTTDDEFALIRRYFQRAAAPSSAVVVGNGDDAAIVATPPGQRVVVCTDMLVSGRHFAATAAAVDVGWKSLAVNVSDLLAMAAQPMGFTLALALPEVNPAWLEGFSEGLHACAEHYAMTLLGGDTTRGPLTISITALGWSAAAHPPPCRSHAREGDGVWVSGSLGRAAAALALGDAAPHTWREALYRPRPDPEAVRGVRPALHAMIDVSDGLSSDLGHICRASGLGAVVDAEALVGLEPLEHPQLSQDQRWHCRLHGGDDYVLLATAGPASTLDGWTRIGTLHAQPGLHLRWPNGQVSAIPSLGWNHFS